jgi:amino acid efflux transporter
MSRQLVRTISVSQGVALYVGAVVGAGVLLLPGAGASAAGPASVVAWGFDSALGIPIALTFAALASRHPDAGGVATFTSKAFGTASGTVIGWFYFVAAATAQILVPLTGAYYAAPRIGLGKGGTFLLAGAILAVAVVANARGLRVSARLQLGFSGVVALMLLAAALVSLPRIQAARWTPFAPHGLTAVGSVGVLVFFAFFGWEAITHLSAEFRNPERDVPRSTFLSVALISLLYLGVVVATVGTGTYGTDEVDRTVIARLLAEPLGTGIGVLAATIALLISLGTANAFVAATSRLGYALARDGVFPPPLAKLNSRGVPLAAVLAIGLYAGTGMVISYLVGWGAEDLLVVPNSLVILTYLAGMAAGMRLLAGPRKALALVAFALCLILLPFVGFRLVIPLVIAVAALAYRRRFGPSRAPAADQQGRRDRR